MRSLLLVLTIFSFVFSSGAFAKFVVGKVDIQRILLSVSEGKRVRDQLKKKFEEKQKVLKKEEKSIRTEQESFEKRKNLLSDKKKNEGGQKLQEKILKLQQKSVKYQKEMQGMENKLKKPILEKLKLVIDQVSKKSGVDITFEVSTAPVVYAKESKDLTNDVIKAYDKKHK
jgi:outer membrane protein